MSDLLRPHHDRAETATTAVHPLSRLRQIVQRERDRAGHERCEMCGTTIAAEHRHVVDTEQRTLWCLCPPCYLLFSDPGAAAGRFRQVLADRRALTGVSIDQRQWDRLQIPVGLAFFFVNSTLGRTVAFYPGPAGATESLLPLDAWNDLMATNPDLAAIEPDVEAVLVRRGEGAIDCYLVPIDACYELVGRLRMSWVGFDGGAEARTHIDDFFADLRERCRA